MAGGELSGTWLATGSGFSFKTVGLDPIRILLHYQSSICISIDSILHFISSILHHNVMSWACVMYHSISNQLISTRALLTKMEMCVDRIVNLFHLSVIFSLCRPVRLQHPELHVGFRHGGGGRWEICCATAYWALCRGVFRLRLWTLHFDSFGFWRNFYCYDIHLVTYVNWHWHRVANS